MRIILLSFVLCSGLFFSEAYSALSDDIGVQLSNTCITMIKNGLETNCPTYEEILFLFPDSSEQRISGYFIFKDGYLQREEPKTEENFQFYRYDSVSRFWVDPPADIANRIKLITIQPRIDEFPVKDIKVTNSSIPIMFDSLVNRGCYDAIITSVNWQLRLGNMIQHLGSDCKIDNLDNVKKKEWERTVHDFTTSYKYKLDQWFKRAIEECGKKYCIPT